MNFSPSQVSEMLHIPHSTLRLYASKFSSHLSDQGKRKQRLYTQGDLAIIQQIRDLAASNLPFAEIGSRLTVLEETLAGSKPLDGLEASETSKALSLIPEVSMQLAETRQIANAALAQMKTLVLTVEQQAQTIERLRESNDYQQQQLFINKKEIDELKRYKSKLPFLDTADDKVKNILSRLAKLEKTWLFRLFK